MDYLLESLVAIISDVLLVVGCTGSRSGIMSMITSQFGASLANLAGHLDKMLKEITRNNFDVFTARPREKFDGESMENTEPEGDGVQGAKVLCTTSIGLIKRIPAETLLKTRRQEKIIVLKAKVLLESFLDY